MESGHGYATREALGGLTHLHVLYLTDLNCKFKGKL